MSVLVFVESKENAVAKAGCEAISYAKKLGGDVTVITNGSLGEDVLGTLGEFGASKVLVNRELTSNNEQQLTRLITAAADSVGASIVVLAQDQLGKAVGPRVAVKLSAGHASSVIALPDTSSGFAVKTNAFSGKAFAHVAINSDKKVLSLMPNSFAAEKVGGQATVEGFSADLGGAGITVKETKIQSGDVAPLPEAEMVVSGGRGLKGPENWNLVEDLAQTLGATTACSRPVADIGWRPHHEHVGQTGIAIRPNLYIAVGISGAIQHLAGVNGSKTIVVINTDAEAPFFKAADYGVVGDAFEVLPKLTAAIEKFKAFQN